LLFDVFDERGEIRAPNPLRVWHPDRRVVRRSGRHPFACR
jgi:hypothetical protein